MLHGVLDLPASDPIQMEQQDSPARGQRQPRLPAACGERAQHVAHQSLDDPGTPLLQH